MQTYQISDTPVFVSNWCKIKLTEEQETFIMGMAFHAIMTQQPEHIDDGLPQYRETLNYDEVEHIAEMFSKAKITAEKSQDKK